MTRRVNRISIPIDFDSTDAGYASLQSLFPFLLKQIQKEIIYFKPINRLLHIKLGFVYRRNALRLVRYILCGTRFNVNHIRIG